MVWSVCLKTAGFLHGSWQVVFFLGASCLFCVFCFLLIVFGALHV